jgi:hypothetical protein
MKQDGPPDAWRSRREAAGRAGLDALASAAAGADTASDSSTDDPWGDCPDLLDFGADSDDGDEAGDQWEGLARLPPPARAPVAAGLY